MGDTKKPVRVWADGVFDLVHWGHFNALRQSKQLGDQLVVGVHSDEECLKHKGPTVLNLKERTMMVEGCKWVDECLPGMPYVTTLETMDKYNTDFCTHGEDITLDENGVDTYKEIKDAGRMKTIKRAEGVSTTDLIGRMLLITKTHHTPAEDITNNPNIEKMSQGPTASPYTSICEFVPTTTKIVQFSNGKEPNPGDKIVYMDGAFDLFHPGHVAALKKAKELGDFLLVGIYNDQSVNEYKGANHPIMNIHERVLSVLSCRYVDEVIIGAPVVMTKDFIEAMKIDIVAVGPSGAPWQGGAVGEIDPYEVPYQMGLLKQVSHSMAYLTTTEILNRIIKNRQVYESRNRKKETKEINYLKKIDSQELKLSCDDS